MDRTDRAKSPVAYSVQRYCYQQPPICPAWPTLGRLESWHWDLIQHPMSSLGFVFDKKEHNEAVLKYFTQTITRRSSYSVKN